MKYQIYKTTNKTNGKVYVGMHRCSCKKCYYMGSGKLLKKAIKKHSIINFTKTILFEYDNEQDMINKEKELVTEQFCSLDTNYNICEGGKGGWSYVKNNPILEAKRIKKSAPLSSRRMKLYKSNQKKEWISNPEKKLEFCKLISNGVLKRFKEKGHNWIGRKHSDATKKKMSESMKGLQSGSKNSQYGTMWITNGIENRKIKKNNIFPIGFYKGRI